MSAPRVFLLAGEASGDRLGAALMRGLRAEAPGVSFGGVGGEAMAAEGLESLFPMSDLSVMGFAEVVPHLARIRRRLREAADAVAAARPDALVTIDAQVFAAMLAKRAKRRAPGTARVHYVAPTVWAWKPWRAKRAARTLDRMLALFPFEPPLFERHGLPCDFVGHPVVEKAQARDRAAEGALRDSLGIPAEAPLLLVAPGSRASEVSRLLEPFGAAAARLAGRVPGLRAVVPLAPAVARPVREAVAGWGLPVHSLEPVEGGFAAAEARKMAAFGAADAALAASGSVTLELAAAGTPVVVGYRVPRSTEFLVRRLVRLDTFTLTNIVLGERIVPEFVQDECEPERLADALAPLLADTPERRRQVDGAGRLMAALGAGDGAPGVRAARGVLRAIEERRSGPLPRA